MNIEELQLHPENFLFQLISDAARAEQKIDQVLENQNIMNERINKREAENDALRLMFDKENKDLRDIVHDLKNELVVLKTSQSNNWKWFMGIGTISAGLGAIGALIFMIVMGGS